MLFVQAINVLIVQARDHLSLYWVSTIDVPDLHQVTVDANGIVASMQDDQVARGLQEPFLAPPPQREVALRNALQEGVLCPVWRQIQLDGIDAFAMGRFDDSVVLSWGALEAACRSVLPGLAHMAGKTPQQLGSLVGTRNNTANPPYSYEDAIDRQSSGFNIVEAVAQLHPHLIYTEDTVQRFSPCLILSAGPLRSGALGTLPGEPLHHPIQRRDQGS